MYRQNTGLVSRQQIINEIADDRVWFVAKLRHHTTNQSAAASVPFQVDRAVQITRTMDFRPAMWSPRLFGPDFDKVEFLLQQRIAHDFGPERSLSGGDYLDKGLQLSLGSADCPTFATPDFSGGYI